MEQADFPTGISGPVLLLADNLSIAAAAPRWAADFAAAGTVHRVRVVGHPSQQEIAAVLAEAKNLGAATILAAGSGSPLAVGQAVACRLGLPLFTTDS